jgi:AraC-like DNA-binding protein
MEFEPLGAAPADTGFVLHEAGYWAKTYAWNFPKVYSPFWRIYYDYEAGHYVRFGVKLTPLGPDRLLIIPNHQRFDCVGDPPIAKLWFAFSCNRNADPAQRMPIVLPINASMTALLDEFPTLFRSHNPDNRQRVFRHSLAFVLYVLNQPKIRWQKSLPPHIALVVAAINADPAHAWTNKTLAQRASMSTDGFARTFRSWLHNTPARYVQQVRIREACRLLTGSEDSIDAIAKKLGFSDRFHFTRVFKRITNATPARYRKPRIR